MEQHEIFRVFEACQPTIQDVKAYLEWKASDLPFEVIFVKNGKKFAAEEISRNMGRPHAIIIENMVFYVKTFNKAEAGSGVVTADVFDFAKHISSRAVPLSKKAADILRRNRKKYKELVEKMAVFGYEIPHLPEYVIPLTKKELNKKELLMYDLVGCADKTVDINQFLNDGNCFMFYRHL